MWVLKFVGIQNVCVLKIYLYSKFAGLKFEGTQKSWVLKLLVFILKIVLILKFLDTVICGYSKFWEYSKFVGTQNL